MTKPVIRDRLVNWAICVRVVEKQGISPTGQFLEQLKRNAGQWGYEDEAGPTREVDEADAYLVEKAWRNCSPSNKEFLRMLYVWNAQIGWICRRLQIPSGRRERGAFDIRRHHAETEIARYLDAPPVAQKPPSNR